MKAFILIKAALGDLASHLKFHRGPPSAQDIRGMCRQCAYCRALTGFENIVYLCGASPCEPYRRNGPARFVKKMCEDVNHDAKCSMFVKRPPGAGPNDCVVFVEQMRPEDEITSVLRAS